jgi:crossover junction endodeoxyribonuclease RuvC
MIVAGVDPALQGAIAWLDSDRFVTVADLPIHEVKNGKRVKRSLDLGMVRELLTQRPIDHLVIEAVHSMPKQGVTSMFSFGTSYGSILGLAAGLRCPTAWCRRRRGKKGGRCSRGPASHA